MPIYTGGLEITAPRGPAGPDGNPVGTVLAYMGLTAPSDYLVCDGATYDIAAYSDLAKFFEVQFGSSNFFGGDGEETFAVPNMKDLFLRGYNSDEDGLSGELGEKQEATTFPTFHNTSINGEVFEGGRMYLNPDFTGPNTRTYLHVSFSDTGNGPSYITSRPVNMAVNYIIKATNSHPILDEYDTDDGWHVRKWSDGYVEMTRFDNVSATWTDSDYGLINDSVDYYRAYPFELVQMYSSTISLRNSDNIIGDTKGIFTICARNGTHHIASADVSRLKSTGCYILYSYNFRNVTVNVGISFHVTGRWK